MATVDLPFRNAGMRSVLMAWAGSKPGSGLSLLTMILLSVLLHLAVWQGRGWLAYRPEVLKKPSQPVVVNLLPPPKPESPQPGVEPPKPISPQPKSSPLPKSRPLAASAPAMTAKPAARPMLRPAAPPKSHPRAAAPEALSKVRPVMPPKPIAPPIRSVKPTRRELEDDPNLSPPSDSMPSRQSLEPVRRREAPAWRPLAPPPPELSVRSQPLSGRPSVRSPVPLEPRALPPRADSADTRALADQPTVPGPAARPRGSGQRRESEDEAERSRAAGSSANRSSTSTGRASDGLANGSYEGAKANAAYLHNPKPEYPALAMRRQWEGKVVLLVRVLADGSVAAVSVATSSGHEVLDEAALEAVRAWHFVPARQGGRAVESWANVPINFNLLDSQ